MQSDFDLLIIGGGINGCGIARDAAGRGLSVCVAEMGDIGGATSSSSTKLFHGGLRYLEYFEVRLVREALKERETLLRAIYAFDQPYATTVNDSLRLVVDMADEEKVWFHFPGGNSERLFDPANTTFLDDYLAGKPGYLWFSDKRIEATSSMALTLTPTD